MNFFGNVLRRHLPWLLLLLGLDLFFALLLWLADAKAFQILVGLILLASLALFAGIFFILYRKERQKVQLFQDFLTTPDSRLEEKLLRAVSQEEGDSIRLLATVLREKQQLLDERKANLSDYEEYVESWAHEAKTPLSLLTMLLDNRADELSAPLQAKLNHVRSQLQEDITQMLYYARLKGSTKDYLFEAVGLHSCAEEVLLDYAPLLEEKQFVVQNEIPSDETVYTDRRGLQFMLGQIISNAIKYSSDAPKLTISMEHQPQKAVLRIRDNGVGVKPYDLPYIFQKGFTGDSTDSQKKATGMGLYLTRKMASDLGVTVEASSKFSEGFQISILFPEIQ